MKIRNNMKKNRGFTLIELLVVIAIIGILSSVVLASLNTARAKGSDAAIKANLGNIRAQAEIFYDANNHYGVDSADCVTASSIFVDTTITAAIVAAETASGGSASCLANDGVLAAGTAATSWAISVPLKTDPLESWCIDYTGVATTAAATLVADMAVCQ